MVLGVRGAVGLMLGVVGLVAGRVRGAVAAVFGVVGLEPARSVNRRRTSDRLDREGAADDDRFGTERIADGFGLDSVAVERRGVRLGAVALGVGRASEGAERVIEGCGRAIRGEGRETDDREGVDRETDDREGVDRETDDREGVDRETDDREGVDRETDDREGIDRETDDREGIDREADDREADDREGIDREADDRECIDREADDRECIDLEADDREGDDREADGWLRIEEDGARDGPRAEAPCLDECPCLCAAAGLAIPSSMPPAVAMIKKVRPTRKCPCPFLPMSMTFSFAVLPGCRFGVEQGRPATQASLDY